jgi:hypothetical protein
MLTKQQTQNPNISKYDLQANNLVVARMETHALARPVAVGCKGQHLANSPRTFHTGPEVDMHEESFCAGKNLRVGEGSVQTISSTGYFAM